MFLAKYVCSDIVEFSAVHFHSFNLVNILFQIYFFKSFFILRILLLINLILILLICIFINSPLLMQFVSFLFKCPFLSLNSFSFFVITCFAPFLLWYFLKHFLLTLRTSSSHFS